jgi:hypothetical protein
MSDSDGDDDVKKQRAPVKKSAPPPRPPRIDEQVQNYTRFNAHWQRCILDQFQPSRRMHSITNAAALQNSAPTVSRHGHRRALGRRGVRRSRAAQDGRAGQEQPRHDDLPVQEGVRVPRAHHIHGRAGRGMCFGYNSFLGGTCAVHFHSNACSRVPYTHARVPSGRPPAARRAGCSDRQHAGPLENHNADRRLAGARCSQSRVRLRVLILYPQFLRFEIRITFLFPQSKYLRWYRSHCDRDHRLITGSTITRIYHRGGWDWHVQSFLKFWRLAAPTEEDPTASLIFMERTGWVLESSQRNRSAAASAVDGEFVEMSIRYSFPTQPSELWQRVPPPS